MEVNLMLYGGAVLLGAFHAFEPGHGKALIGAYMLSTRGRIIDGIILGLVVTFTHTFSVVVLGVLATLLSGSFSDATLHAWLGLVSAALILAAGAWMLKMRLSPATAHSHVHLFGGRHCHHPHSHPDHHHDHGDEHGHRHGHDHHHDHDHDHPHDHSHDHGHGHEDQEHDRDTGATTHGNRATIGQLLLLGISGGLVPCPAGIATLLAAIGAGKIAQGLAVTLFFSLGLGLVMMSIGVILAQAGRLTRKFGDNPELGRRIGIGSALIIISLGLYTLYNSLSSILGA